MRMKNKEAILKMLEALISLFMVFTIMALFIPREPVELQQDPRGFLSILAKDDDFRNCIIAKNNTCINQTIDKNLEDSFDFTFNLSDNPSATVSDLPSVQVFSEAIYISGNVTNISNTILRAFYWNKNE